MPKGREGVLVEGAHDVELRSAEADVVDHGKSSIRDVSEARAVRLYGFAPGNHSTCSSPVRP
jgi:hypothetical protein